MRKKTAPKGYHTVTEIAEFGHVTPAAIYQAIVKNRLKAQKINRQWCVMLEDYNEYRSTKYNTARRTFQGEPIFDMEKGHFSVPQISKILSDMMGCHYRKQRIYYLIRNGQLKAFRKGHSWVIDKAEATAFIDKECSPNQQQVSFL